MSYKFLSSFFPRFQQGVQNILDNDLVKPFLTPLSSEDVYVWKDIPYKEHSDHDKHKLDVYVPSKPFPRKPSPVCVFVHGGSWMRGDRNYNSVLYKNVGLACARAGIVGVVISYRLSPEVQHPGHVNDVRSATEWVAKNVSKYGGDDKRVVLAGHSAGAHLVSLMLCEEQLPDSIQRSVKGFVGISGVYDLISLQDRLSLAPYMIGPVFGEEVKTWEEASPLHRLRETEPQRKMLIDRIPVLLLTGEEEWGLEEHSVAMDRVLRERRKGEESRAPVMKEIIRRRNHISVITSVGQEQDDATRFLTEFCHSIAED